MLEVNLAASHFQEPESVDSNISESVKVRKMKPIELNDILPLMGKGVKVEDQDVEAVVHRHAIFCMEVRLKRLNNSIDEYYGRWPEATPVQLYVAYDMTNCDKDEMIYKIGDQEFRNDVTKEINQRFSNQPTPPHSDPEQESNSESDKSSDDEEFVFNEREFEVSAPKTVKPRPKQVKSTPIGKSPPGIPQDIWESWSEARRNSYNLGAKFPNAYYYRHLPPDEKQKNGSWTKDEKQLFLKRLREMRADSDTMNGDWGLFSLSIPGRVGYQCSNFYRKLIESGEVTDSRYFRGSDGKIHHLSRAHVDGKGKPVPNHYKKGKNRDESASEPKQPKKCLRSLRTSEIQSLTLFSSSKRRIVDSLDGNHMSRYEEWSLQNPVEGVLDEITKAPMKVPAISPDGYILDYNTWLTTLKTAHENPFTRMPMNKRQLVVLTFDNYEEYKHKIVNLKSNDC